MKEHDQHSKSHPDAHHYFMFAVNMVLSLVVMYFAMFIASMIPHHSGAILMCREANLKDRELIDLCSRITEGQRKEIEQMKSIEARLYGPN